MENWIKIGLAFTAIITAQACTSQSDSLDSSSQTPFIGDIINNAGAVIGTATITDRSGDGGVTLIVAANDIPEGPHGMHFHEKADCSSPDFKSAGGHINPDGHQHGLKNPDGPDNADMPNGIADANNHLAVNVNNDRVTLVARDHRPALLDSDGSALIIHINPDDQITQPIGGAGARIACMEIRK